MDQQSKLVLYSYGIVAANKSLKSNTIQVTPMEQVNMTDGELTDNLTTENVKVDDASGAQTEAVVRSASTLTARWLPFSSNRKTAPDVRRGEKVCVWKFADADKYYWSELEYEGKYRKLETVIYAFSNTQDENADEAADNTYFLEISTHTKTVRFHTSTSDGEPFGYDIVLDTKNGNFRLIDTIENMIYMDSSSKMILFRNAAETFINMNDKDLLVSVPGDYTTHVKGKYSVIAEGGFYVKAPTEAIYETPKLSTSKLLQTGDNVICGGAVMIAKGLTTGTDGSSGGHISLNGNIEASGTAQFVGTVTAEKYFGDGSALTGI